MSGKRDKNGRQIAPDGVPWPAPVVLVSRREQTPWTFGWAPVQQPEEGARVELHLPRALPASLIVRELEGPYPCDWTPEDAPLNTGDYTLRHPEHGQPMTDLVLIERKDRDLASSLTHGHDRLLEEMQRMADLGAKHRYLIACADGDALMEGRCGCGTRVKAMVHCIESIAMRHGVQVRQYGSPSRAEYVAALVLQRAWRGYLQEHPEALRCARASEAVQQEAPQPEAREPAAPAPRLRPAGGSRPPTLNDMGARERRRASRV